MKIFQPKFYLSLTAFVLLIFSVALLLFPQLVMQLLGITYSKMGAVFLQFLGASLAAHAYLNWHSRSMNNQVLRPVFYMNIVALSLAVLISLFNLPSSERFILGVLILLMHATFLTGFLLLLKKVH